MSIRTPKQTAYAFTGEKDEPSEGAGFHLIEPGEKRRVIGRIQNAEQRTTKRGGAFLLEHGHQLLELPAFRKRMNWFLENRRDLRSQISCMETGENIS